MKTIKTFFLVLTLTASMALADDGHTNTGNRCDTCPPCTENCGSLDQGSALSVTEAEGSTEASAANEAAYESYEYWMDILTDVLFY